MIAQSLLECDSVENFDKLVLKNDKPVIVKFGADWCPPCKKLEETLKQKITKSNGWKVVVINVDLDSVAQLVKNHSVQPIPHVFLYNKGKQLNQFVGNDQSKLAAMLEEAEKLSK